MSPPSLSIPALAAGAAVIALASAATGWKLTHVGKPMPTLSAPPSAATPKPLYWYDPMAPSQHFEKPGKSPFMDMQLVPRYPDPGAVEAAAGAPIASGATQNLGMRLATVQRGSLAQDVDATGVLDFNQRDIAVIQARAAGFVQRVYGRAPGDLIRAGAPIADLLIPSWGAAQAEYLAVKQMGAPALEGAARQRLRLLGMPDSLIEALTKDGRLRTVVTIASPIAGALQSLEVRQAMTVATGQTLAQVSGLSSVWLNAAVPEALSGKIRVGQSARIDLAAYPGEALSGRVLAILPAAQADSRTLQVRIALPNKGGRLRPGMFATVHLSGPAKSALFVPSEAVIRTGRRALVMVAFQGGRFEPTEVRTGIEDGDRTQIVAGLSEGQSVVASGQFLIDSEASLAGERVKPVADSNSSRAQP